MAKNMSNEKQILTKEEMDDEVTEEIIKIDQVIKAKLPPKEKQGNQEQEISLTSLLALSKTSYPINVAMPTMDRNIQPETAPKPPKKRVVETMVKTIPTISSNKATLKTPPVQDVPKSPEVLKLGDAGAGKIIMLDENLFKCSVCQKTFNLKANCKEHLLRHLGDSAKNYPCKSCSKRFINQRDLKQHEVIHSAQSPFECNVCSKTFSRKRVLRNHERTHVGQQEKSSFQ